MGIWIKKKASVILLGVSILLLATALAVTAIRALAAGDACMTCHPVYGCTTTNYGFSECVSEWRNGKLIRCSLSGGACGMQ